MGREMRSLRMQRDAFQDGNRKLRALSRSLGCPHLSAALDVLMQLAWPSIWGEGEGAVEAGRAGPGNRWEGGRFLSPGRKRAALKRWKAVALRT